MGRNQKPSRVALVERVRRLREQQTLRLLPLVELIVRKSRLPDPPFAFDDLVQEGAMACFEACERFDPKMTNAAGQPVKLETFLSPRIWGAIRDYARRHGRLMHGGARTGRQEHIASLSQSAQSGDNGRGNAHRTVTVGDLVSDKSAAQPSLRLEQRAAWQEICRGMNQRERILVLEYFVHGRTLQAISTDLALSESRCWQMLSQILANLRRLDSAFPGAIRASLAG